MRQTKKQLRRRRRRKSGCGYHKGNIKPPSGRRKIWRNPDWTAGRRKRKLHSGRSRDGSLQISDPETEAEDRRIIFTFIDESNEAATEWRIVNPKADQKDQTVSAELIVTEDTVAIKVTKKPQFEADRTEVGFTRNEERDGSTVASIKKVFSIFHGAWGYHKTDENNIKAGV